ncbi:MAG: hypothetical protein DRR19_26730 [Candidatus Parabeggiatoa sp. nov. 1]|nr:MAG: hypothetical protein DRR19_26730 [Gammaproteobacteria bacterium]
MKSNTDNYACLSRRGETFLLEGKYDEAVSIFSRLIADNPTPWVYAHRGEAYRLQKSFNNALDDFNNALNFPSPEQKDYAWAYAHKGETLRDMGMDEKAREEFTTAIEICNDVYAWAFAHRGAAYDLRQPSNRKPALEDFNKAIELYNDYAWAYAWRSWVYLLMGKGTRAYYDLLQAITLDCNIVTLDIHREMNQLKAEGLIKVE